MTKISLRMNREHRHLWAYVTGLFAMSMLWLLFWQMLFNGSPNILIMTNVYGEYWFEFFMINILFALQIFWVIKQMITYWREPDKQK